MWALYVKNKEVKIRGIIGFGEEIPLVESEGIFDEETLVTSKKARV